MSRRAWMAVGIVLLVPGVSAHLQKSDIDTDDPIDDILGQCEWRTAGERVGYFVGELSVQALADNAKFARDPDYGAYGIFISEGVERIGTKDYDIYLIALGVTSTADWCEA